MVAILIVVNQFVLPLILRVINIADIKFGANWLRDGCEFIHTIYDVSVEALEETRFPFRSVREDYACGKSSAKIK